MARLTVATEGERTVPSVCFLLAKHTVRLRRESGSHDVRKLMSVMCNVFFDAQELRCIVKRVEESERLATERTDGNLNWEKFQKEKLKRASEESESSAVNCKKNVLNLLLIKRLSAPYDSVF